VPPSTRTAVLPRCAFEKHEGVIGGGAHAVLALGPIGQQNRLQHVDHLRDVAHVQLVGLAIEDVQAQAGRHRAAHGGLLPQSAVAILVRFGDAIPDAPFIQEQADAAAMVIAIEQRSLFDDGLFHVREDSQLSHGGLRRVFERSVVAVYVIVNRVAIGQAAAGHRVHESARPFGVVAAGAAANQVWLSAAERARVTGVAAELGAGAIRPVIAAAAPCLVAHAPILHVEWLGRAVGGALVGKRAAGGEVQYSIQSRISRGDPDPTLAAKYGSAPISRQNRMNSCVPKLLSST